MRSSEIESLYAQYGPVVLRRARALLGETEAAQDVLHEIFIRLLRSPELLSGVASRVAYFYQATTHACLNRLRHETLRKKHLAVVKPPPERVGHTPAVDDRIHLQRLLASAPEELQQIAVYYYVDQMSQDEIAELVGVSRRTIGHRLDAFRQLAEES